jgi:5-methylcytosine-specific restriction protein B
MYTSQLSQEIRDFLQEFDSSPLIVEQAEHQETRREIAKRVFSPDHLPELTQQELKQFVESTDAWFGIRGRERMWSELFGADGENLPGVRQTLLELFEKAEHGIEASDLNEIRSGLPWIGPAILSEMLACRFPNRFWIWNHKVETFFKSLGVDLKAELEWGSKNDKGEQYLVAGEHLSDLRRALSEEADREFDFLDTDLFVYWSVDHRAPDREGSKIREWLRTNFPQERLAARREGEAKARRILEENLGDFKAGDVGRFFEAISTDWFSGKARRDRFMPALYGIQRDHVVSTLDAFNHWCPIIWRANEDEAYEVVDRFWEASEVAGAGTSLPTALLYLKDPNRFNIWLPIMSKGLSLATGFEAGEWRTGDGYRKFNGELKELRNRFDLPPQALDVVLWNFAKEGEGGPDSGITFNGFTPDTFEFLTELKENNSTEWMKKDDDANKERYQRVLREPLRDLFESVAPTITALNPNLETEAKFGKVLASISKRFPDKEGDYHPYLWGAYYRKDRRKQEDAQLFVNVQHNMVRVGVSVAGASASESLRSFRSNLKQEHELFLALMRTIPSDIEVSVAPDHGEAHRLLTIRSEGDLAPLSDHALIDIYRRYDPGDPVLYEQEFVDEVASLFETLYPIFIFIISENPEELWQYVDEEPAGGIDGVDIYTKADLLRETYLDDGFVDEILALLNDKKQIVLYGPPGTGKTWIAQRIARLIKDQANNPNGEVTVAQFHPSFSYEEFVEGIRPKTVERGETNVLTYPVQSGLFKRFCDESRNKPQRRYVLIIDEINRGELPRIFGELLYLLEYRTNMVRLPYSGEAFSIPSNLYMIGTMNTADRSIAIVDHALRRRFHFVALRPDPGILRSYLEGSDQMDMAWVADLLELLNSQLVTDGVEWHLHIGHSHFMKPTIDMTSLQLIWRHSILPTLEEYFYRDSDRLGEYELSSMLSTLGVALD